MNVCEQDLDICRIESECSNLDEMTHSKTIPNPLVQRSCGQIAWICRDLQQDCIYIVGSLQGTDSEIVMRLL